VLLVVDALDAGLLEQASVALHRTVGGRGSVDAWLNIDAQQHIGDMIVVGNDKVGLRLRHGDEDLLRGGR
jgi:hypothetical protein